MLRLSKKLKPRARRTIGKRKGLRDMKCGTGFWGADGLKLREEKPFWTSTSLIFGKNRVRSPAIAQDEEF
jgi:hypothetical protein